MEQGATVRAPLAPRNLTFEMIHLMSTFLLSSKTPAVKLNPQIWQIVCFRSVRASQSGQFREQVGEVDDLDDVVDDLGEDGAPSDSARVAAGTSDRKGEESDSACFSHPWTSDACSREASLLVSRCWSAFASIGTSLVPSQVRKPIICWSMRCGMLSDTGICDKPIVCFDDVLLATLVCRVHQQPTVRAISVSQSLLNPKRLQFQRLLPFQQLYTM